MTNSIYPVRNLFFDHDKTRPAAGRATNAKRKNSMDFLNFSAFTSRMGTWHFLFFHTVSFYFYFNKCNVFTKKRKFL
jgi:hypothetical protein